MQWRTVSANKNYEVSDTGLVRRIAGGSGKIKKPWKNNKGYLLVDLWQNNKRKAHTVHRLVAFAFLGNPPSEKHEVAHGDGDKLNNHFSNLRWATPKENCADRILHGTNHGARGEKHGKAKLTEDDVGKIRFLISQGHSNTEIAEIFNVSQGNISLIKLGKRWAWLN